MTKECKQQFTLRITQANATQLVVILYEMTLQYLADAEQAAEDAQFLEAVRRTRDVSMNFEFSSQRIQSGDRAFQAVSVLYPQTGGVRSKSRQNGAAGHPEGNSTAL